MRPKLTNSTIDDKLIKKNLPIVRVGNCINARTAIEWSCINCNHIWKTTPDCILNKGTGCAKCAGCKKISNQDLDEYLVNNSIKLIRLENVINNFTNIKFKCLSCGDELYKTPQHVKRKRKNRVDCYKCSNLVQILTNEIIDKRLEFRNIKRISNFDGSLNGHYKAEWQCCRCQNIWKAMSINVLNKGSGCPKCSLSRGESIVLSYLKNKNIIFEIQKWFKTKNNVNLRVDFYVEKYNSIIEYNGIQHYEPSQFGNMSVEEAITAFNKQIKRDEELKIFCIENNINLIELDCRTFNTDNFNIFKNEVYNFLNKILSN